MLKKLLLLLLALPLPITAQTVLSTGAVELSINFVPSYVGTAANPWLLGIRQNTALIEHAGSITGNSGPHRVTLFANDKTRVTVPDDPRFAPLGAPGADAWLLPDVPSNEVLTPGVSTENFSSQPGWVSDGVPAAFLAVGVGSGLFSNNRITLALESFSGPGNFLLYRLSGFGDPIWYFRADDGLSTADTRLFSSQSHSDLNWAFTAPGDYYLGFRASGTLTNGTSTSSDLTTFHFKVVPEPSSAALLLSAAVLVMRRPRTRMKTSTLCTSQP